MPLKEIECLNCGTILKKRVGEAINLSNNPKAINDIIEGKINFSYCPKCKTKIEHKSHVLLTYLDPPRWIWLVSKKYQNPKYCEEFFSSIIPPGSVDFIEQDMVFVDFGIPCESLAYVIENRLPQTSNDWLELGKIHSGSEAVDCYKNALKINSALTEAKSLLNEEMDKLKTYQ
ncbi:MAG: CpXC domain-containing protein [Candidatus Heimdallarchaeaceae archaeon]